MEVQLSEDLGAVNWEELANVFELAPLGHREPEQLKAAFENSDLRCFVYYRGKLIGAGRALSDGVYQAAIYDVVVLPEYQRKGIGTRIMNYLVSRARVGRIIIYVVAGKEVFYERLGFRKMKTAMSLLTDEKWRRQNGYNE
ncbi:MAG TPA: GNAT family N-acetyltransferase [Sedimentisphaerales bacterium]|nr:GNAT family N-acetyltransferase [Sedimentisphaerales bacterium]